MHCDDTYKLNWNCHPVILLGTTDAAKAFYPYGLALCKLEKDENYAFVFSSVKKAVLEFHGADFKPKYLVADEAQAISNGLKKIKLQKKDVEAFKNARDIYIWKNFDVLVKQTISLYEIKVQQNAMEIVAMQLQLELQELHLPSHHWSVLKIEGLRLPDS
ncbi:hypothetical protein BpHYR1_040227 [Brachionus plicatilis]|uniref:MULE transposase domain-containing protein n=1 Tax=Brachionus plicatilis TaxID=10195 RepID=A0A3M7S1I9_BRAPC|nr:hypothetical protein BpHYR1_040227 [Brachionus plicatilis]